MARTALRMLAITAREILRESLFFWCFFRRGAAGARNAVTPAYKLLFYKGLSGSARTALRCGTGCYGAPRRASKKVLRSEPQSSANNPPLTSKRWLNAGQSVRSTALPAAPAFGS